MSIPAEDDAYHYVAYGLHVASSLALPELRPAPQEVATTEPDLRIGFGTVPDDIGEPLAERVTWAGRAGAWRHEIHGVSRYLVQKEGSEVVIERTGGTDADVRAFLFGTTLGAILHQRQMFVLHASAVVGPGGAVVVAGRSGAGKSTTAVELARRGHPILSDDKTVVQFDADGTPMVLSGYPTTRLWEDAVERMGTAPSDLAPLREDARKYLYEVPAFQTEPAPLRAIVVLQPWNEISLDAHDPGDARLDAPGVLVAERLQGPAAAKVLLKMTYRRRIVESAGLQVPHFAWAMRIAGAVPVVQVIRPRLAQTLGEVADAVEAQLARAVAEAG